MERQEIWLRMAQIKGIGGIQMLTCVKRLLQADKVNRSALRQAGLSEERCQAFLQANLQEVRSAMSWLEQPGHHLITQGDDRYPIRLNFISSPPALLFIIGDPQTLQRPQIAMVGSRHYITMVNAGPLTLPQGWCSVGLPSPAGWPLALTVSAIGLRWMRGG